MDLKEFTQLLFSENEICFVDVEGNKVGIREIKVVAKGNFLGLYPVESHEELLTKNDMLEYVRKLKRNIPVYAKKYFDNGFVEVERKQYEDFFQKLPSVESFVKWHDTLGGEIREFISNRVLNKNISANDFSNWYENDNTLSECIRRFIC